MSQSKGLRASDEAFKMAYTDAVGNALKYLGVSADVHMGRFDDNKYVQGLEKEFAQGDRVTSPAVESQVRTIRKLDYENFLAAAKQGGFTAEQIKIEITRRGFDSASLIPVDDFAEMMQWARGEL